MFWGKDKGDKDGGRDEQRPEQPSTDQASRAKLPHKLQQLVDREDDNDELYSEYASDSTHTPYRYAAYANRIRTILLSAHRYIAYTSDIGESFRPVAHPYLVRSAYAISWTYILGDVGHEGYRAFLRNRHALIHGEAHKEATDLNISDAVLGMATGNIAGPLTSPHKGADAGSSNTNEKTEPPVTGAATQIPLVDDYRMVMAKRAVFQTIASMGLPAFTIHSVVRYSGRAFKNSKSTFLRTWAPIGLGLSVVPLLPSLFDEPAEHVIDKSFETLCRYIGGEQAVRSAHTAKEVPAETPLGKLLDQKKDSKGDAPSYREDPKHQEQRPALGSSGWFGFGKKDKEE